MNKREKVFELITRTESVIETHKAMIDGLVREILSEEMIDKDEVLRRDYDGNSSAEFLVEKMIGEYLAAKKIHY